MLDYKHYGARDIPRNMRRFVVLMVLFIVATVCVLGGWAFWLLLHEALCAVGVG